MTALVAVTLGGCSLTALVGVNPTPLVVDAAIDDASSPPDAPAPVDAPVAPDLPGSPDVPAPIDVPSSPDVPAPIDAGGPGDSGRFDDSPSRPIEAGRPDAEPVMIDVGSSEASMTAKGIDGGRTDDAGRTLTPCALDRDCIGERIPSRCDPVQMFCVPR